MDRAIKAGHDFCHDKSNRDRGEKRRTNVMNRILTLVGLLSISMSVNAAPLTWTLNNVEFEDGGTASGSFVYDADASVFSVMNIITSGGAADFPGVTYTVGGGVSSFVTGLTQPFGTDLTGTWAFQVNLTQAMTNAGGTIEFGSSGEALCGDELCTGTEWVFVRAISGGSISAVPIPAAAWLFGSALLGLGVIKRKRA